MWTSVKLLMRKVQNLLLRRLRRDGLGSLPTLSSSNSFYTEHMQCAIKLILTIMHGCQLGIHSLLAYKILYYCCVHRQALTEISVLTDVLQISLHHPQYVTLVPLNDKVNKPDSVSPAYQYIVKKKALSVAAGILRKGTSSLTKASSHGEREFHRALLEMRHRWRLRRLPNGMIQGDLSYTSGTMITSLYLYIPQKPMCSSTAYI